MEMKRGGSPADKLHPVSPHVGMHLDPSIAWGNDEDDYGNYEEIQTNPNNASISSSISPIQQPTTSFPTMQSPSSSTHPPLKSRKRTTKSSSVYAKSNTSRMQRTTSKFDLGAMQLSGMGLSHSASTLNFLQNALDDELSAAQLNRVPSWAKIASNQNSIKSSGRNGKSLSNNNNSNNNNNNNMTSIPPVGFLNTDSKGKHVPWGVTSPPGSPARDAHTVLPKIRLGAILKPLRNGTEAIVDDSFWRCFEDREDVGWNWNFYLFPVWCVGVLVRYLILFPIRVFLLLLGMIVFFIGFFCIRLWYLIGCNCRCCGHSNNLSVEAGLVRLFALSFVVSWSGVIRYHGIRPSDTMKKRVFVANHSSMIDVTMLLQRDNYSLVGQAHKSWIRFIQNVMLESLQCVWFNRGETKDRNAVFQKLQKHARNENGDLPVSKLFLDFLVFFSLSFSNQSFFIYFLDPLTVANILTFLFVFSLLLTAFVSLSRRYMCQYRSYYSI